MHPLTCLLLPCLRLTNLLFEQPKLELDPRWMPKHREPRLRLCGATASTIKWALTSHCVKSWRRGLSLLPL